MFLENLLKNFTIKTRLISLVGFAITLMVAIGVMGLTGMHQTETSLKTVYDDRLVPTGQISQINAMMQDSRTQLLLALQHDPGNSFSKMHDHPIDNHINVVEANIGKVTAIWQAFMATHLTDQEKRLAAEYTAKRNAYVDEGLKPVINELRAGRYQDANKLILQRVNPTFSAAFAEAEKLLQLQLDVAGTEYQQAQSRYTLTRNATTMLLMLGIAVSALLAWVTIGGITHAVAELKRASGEVAAGNLTVSADYQSTDELGQTAKDFNNMLSAFRSVIADTKQSGAAIAEAAQAMAAAGTQVSSGSAAQSEAASAVAAAIEETSTSISETAGNARAADETAVRAQVGIERTLAAMRETVANVEDLAGMINEASGNISQLDESSKKIGGIVQVIKEIADQTNLLALNAAIEAARAGEQGRGFAVVADEVRKLAENTSKATNEISGLIGGIQAQIDASVAQMRQANSRATHGRELVASSETALNTAGADTRQATANVRSIADAMHEQDAAVQQVASRIEHIARLTEENTAAACSAAGTATELDQLASRLHQSVVRFRT